MFQHLIQQPQGQDANQKPGPEVSVQDLAARAASRYMASTVKSIKTPKTAYDFEVSWRALSDDTTQQIQLLKVYFQLLFFLRIPVPFTGTIVSCVISYLFSSSRFHQQAYQRFSRTHFLHLFLLTSRNVQPQFSGRLTCYISFCLMPVWDHGCFT